MSKTTACCNCGFGVSIPDAEILPNSVPDWVSTEVKATWAAMQGVGQMEAYRIMERMVRRLGYRDLRDQPLVEMPT